MSSVVSERVNGLRNTTSVSHSELPRLNSFAPPTSISSQSLIALNSTATEGPPLNLPSGKPQSPAAPRATTASGSFSLAGAMLGEASKAIAIPRTTRFLFIFSPPSCFPDCRRQAYKGRGLDSRRWPSHFKLTRCRRARQSRLHPTLPKRGAGASRLDVDPVEGVPAERAEFEVHHFLAHRLQLHRVRNREPGRLFFEYDLRLAVKLRARGLVADGLCFPHQFLERLIAEFCNIGPVGPRRIASKQRVQKVVGVAVVAGPAELRHQVLAVLGALAILAPLEAPDLGRNADLGEIGLHQLGDAPRIGIVGSLHRHRPQVRRKAVRISG